MCLKSFNALELGLWTRVFYVGEWWVGPRKIVDFLITNFRGFGGNGDLKKFWVCYVVLWSMWLERNR